MAIRTGRMEEGKNYGGLACRKITRRLFDARAIQHGSGLPAASTTRLRGEDNELGIPKDVWEQVTGADGSIYFHNRDTNETAWEIPNEWEEVLDEDGNTYYHNRSTGETSWDPPMMTNPMRK